MPAPKPGSHSQVIRHTVCHRTPVIAQLRYHSRPMLVHQSIPRRLFAFLILVLGFSGSAEAQRDPSPSFHGDTEVVASRIGTTPAEVGRRSIVIDREEIAMLPVQTIQDLLAVLPGVGLTRRGARGVQGDLNLRGGTFEQSVVMVNGIRVNNPQTGHHNLDLFIPLQAIERVEILYGPGSAVHGPDAFGGAVNIVTGVSDPTTLALRVGENHLSGASLAGQWNDLWGAIEREVHTGFRENTEADVNQGAAGWSATAGESRLEIAATAGRRRFGAHSFYSTRYPDQRERTEGQLITIGGLTPLSSNLTLHAALRLDRHEDDFVLDRHQPEWFHNHHETSGLLADLSLRGSWGSWSWAAGLEAAHEDIDSSNLGRHDQDRKAAFAEIGRLSGPVTFAVQGRIDTQNDWGTVTTGAVSGRWRFDADWALRASWGQSFRAPSFTDLYYDSPSTSGNPDLEPERGQTLEIGLEGKRINLTVFRRETDPLIDYLLDNDNEWRAANIGRSTTNGLEAALALPVAGPLVWQRFGATWLKSEIDVDPARSRYGLSHPRLEAAWTGGAQPGEGWRAGWALRYRLPESGGSWSTLDLRLGQRILSQMWLDLEANNVFDRSITEVTGVPLPGRWVSLTLTWRRGPK